MWIETQQGDLINSRFVRQVSVQAGDGFCVINPHYAKLTHGTVIATYTNQATARNCVLKMRNAIESGRLTFTFPANPEDVK